MANAVLRVPRIDDRSLYKFMTEAAEALKSNKFTINEIGVHGHHTVTLGSAKDPYWSKSALHSVNDATLSQGNVSVHLTVGKDSRSFDLSVNNGSPEQDEEGRNLNSIIEKHFWTGSGKGSSGDLEQIASVQGLNQQMLLHLQSATTRVTESIAEAHARLEAEFSARQKQLDVDLQKRSQLADKAIEAERKQLREREDALEERRRKIDDRDNTTARRAQHAILKSRIAERAGKFHITAETKRARWPIHVGVGAGCALLAYFLWLYATAVASLPAEASLALVLAASVKPIGLTIALLGLVAWYLRWMNRWFERYADTEFFLKQFELDIDRANWVVETALEWKEKQDRTIPESLLGSISRNLFTKAEKDEDANMHPADYLASAILGTASNVNLKVPGAEIALTGRGIKKLQKEEPPAA